MNRDNIKFSRLTDMARLNEIFELTYDSFVESGLICQNDKKTIDLYPHLDKLKETAIIIAEKNNKIIATNSITIDNICGLHTDEYFKDETNNLRNQYKELGSSWRIATTREFRGDARLIKELIGCTIATGKELGITHCLYIFAKRHERVYGRLIRAKTIAHKNCGVPGKPVKIDNIVLMISNLYEAKPLTAADSVLVG